MEAIIIRENEVDFAKALGANIYIDSITKKIFAVANKLDKRVFATERAVNLKHIPESFQIYKPRILKKMRNRIEEYLRKNATIVDLVKVAKLLNIPVDLRIAGYMMQSKQFGDLDGSTQITSIHIFDCGTGEEFLDQTFDGNIWDYQFEDFDYYLDDDEYDEIVRLFKK